MKIRRNIGKMKRKIVKIAVAAKKTIMGEQEQYLVENIGLNFLQKKQPRVLICYIDFEVVNKVIRSGATHCNQLEYYQMIRYFIDLGYDIDICSYDYLGDIKSEFYDVIFGFGNAFFKAKQLNPNAKEIFFMTENPYWFSFSREQERVEYFIARHKFLPNDYAYRSGRCFKQNDEKECKRILTFGDKSLITNGDAYVKRIFPSGFGDDTFVFHPEKRNRKTFLCLASNGFIHKGYDILIDLFDRHPDWSLVFCGGGIEDNATWLHLTLPCNIIDYGFVRIPSEQFRNLCNKCSSILLFSCSEGMSTSLITAMRMGLVPITCKGNGMEACKGKVIFAENFYIEKIEESIVSFINMSEDTYIKLCKEIYKYANANFTLQSFNESFKRAVDELLVV